MQYTRFFFLSLLLLSLLGCKESNTPHPVTYVTKQKDLIDDSLVGTDFNILFIGNSLTFTNNLPELVQNEARNRGLNIGIKMEARANFAISDHWDNGTVQDLIKTKVFKFVVIQQGPSSQSLGRSILIEYGQKYSDLCKANDANLAFFMVWPSLAYYYTFDGVIKNYSDAANLYDSYLCPVGEVWKQHFDNTNDFSYYGPDGFHPSYLGSEVAAQVIAESLFD